MNILLKDINKSVKISSCILNAPFNKSLIHQIIRCYQLNLRQGTVSQKTRSEVKGSKKKPWRQKGTGRARAGTYKSPIWRSGGITFANKCNKNKRKINRKMYINAFKSILSQLYKESRLYIISDLCIDIPKTKLFLNKFNFVNLNKLLIIIKNYNNLLFLSSRNLYNIKLSIVNSLNLIDLIKYKNIVFTLDSIKYLEGKLLNEK